MGCIISTGIIVEFPKGANELVAELVDIQFDGEEGETQDSTHQSAETDQDNLDPAVLTNGRLARLFCGKLFDAGGATMTLHYDPDDTFPTIMTKGIMLVQWPDGTTNKFEATAILDRRGAIDATLGNKITEEVHFKFSGSANWKSTATITVAGVNDPPPAEPVPDVEPIGEVEIVD